MKHVSSTIDDKLYYLMEKECKINNIPKTRFIKIAISEKLGVLDNSVTKPKSNLLSNLKREFGVENVEFVETSEKEEDIEIPVKSKYHPRINDVWKLSDSLLKKVSNYEERNYFLDYESGLIKFTSPYNRATYSTLSLNELLILKEYNPITYGEVRHVKEIFGLKSNNSTMNPSIFLWQQGVFDDIIFNFKTKVKHCKFGVKNDYLLIMGERTNIPIYNVEEIVSRIQNGGFTEVGVFKICRSYHNMFNPMEVRIICENYDNPELLKLLKNDDTVFVENNPSKRRNMIRNGGL